MASDVSICNLALSYVATDPIDSLSERSKPAIECKRIYEFVRDTTLRDHDWGFARKQEVLALLGETRSGWDYVYRYPIDCIAARGIYDPSGVGATFDEETDSISKYGGIEYEIAADSTLSKRVVLTNQENAELIYTAKVTDVNAYDSSFVEAFSLHMGAYLAVSLKRDKALKASLLQDYMRKLGVAQAVSANEGHKIPDNSSSFTRSRQ